MIHKPSHPENEIDKVLRENIFCSNSRTRLLNFNFISLKKNQFYTHIFRDRYINLGKGAAIGIAMGRRVKNKNKIYLKLWSNHQNFIS